jgi:uncharacterized membrane protein YhaH (DUF805 family)
MLNCPQVGVAVMFGFFFGFHARLGRLHYFLSCIGFGLVMAAIIFAMVSFAFRNAAADATSSANLIILPVLCLVPFVLWITISLQSMRIRDIGWNPAYVVPAWLMICALDAYVAAEVPEWAIGKGHQTLVGGMINFFLTLALMFWPSGSYDDKTPTDDEPRRPRTEPYSPPPAAPPRPASPAIRRDATGRPRFGQRGL